MTADEAIQKLHDTHGDYLAEIIVDKTDDGWINVNIQLLKYPTDEPIGLISFNATTLTEALGKAAST